MHDKKYPPCHMTFIMIILKIGNFTTSEIGGYIRSLIDYSYVIYVLNSLYYRSYLKRSSHPKICKNGPINSQLYAIQGPFLQIFEWLGFVKYVLKKTDFRFTILMITMSSLDYVRLENSILSKIKKQPV